MTLLVSLSSLLKPKLKHLLLNFPMSNQDQTPSTGFGLSAITRTGEATMASVILILILFVYLLVLYLRKKRYVGVHPPLGSSRARRLVFATTAAPGRAVDPAVISSLAVTIFHASDFDERLECAVCLSELAGGEKVRLLPKCKHGFHLECIDMWFASNSTCPLCRIPVGIANSLKRADVANCSMPVLAREEVSRLPTSEEMMVIEMPSSSSRSGMEDGKAPALTSLRSVRRILSRGSMGIGLACSPRRCDIEQGGVEGAPPVSVSEAQTSSQ